MTTTLKAKRVQYLVDVLEYVNELTSLPTTWYNYFNVATDVAMNVYYEECTDPSSEYAFLDTEFLRNFTLYMHYELNDIQLYIKEGPEISSLRVIIKDAIQRYIEEEINREV